MSDASSGKAPWNVIRLAEAVVISTVTATVVLYGQSLVGEVERRGLRDGMVRMEASLDKQVDGLQDVIRELRAGQLTNTTKLSSVDATVQALSSQIATIGIAIGEQRARAEDLAARVRVLEALPSKAAPRAR